jgi:Tfp pilus assembly protein PilZ
MPAGMRATRARTSIPVEFETDDLRGTGKIKNVGLGGLFVGSQQIPEQGESVSLSFHFPGGQELSVQGVVWWTTRETTGRHRTPGFGLRLIEENEGYELAVNRLLR